MEREDTRDTPNSPALFLPIFASRPRLDVSSMPEEFLHFSIGFVVALMIALAAWKRGSLGVSGLWATLAIGTIIFSLGGLLASIALVVFFLSSTLLSHMPSRGGQHPEQPSRNWLQVFANGGVPAFACMLFTVRPELREQATLLFFGALATSTADTWATEVGTRFGGIPRDVLTGKPRAIGASGGVSILGLLASAAGAMLIGVLSSLRLPESSTCQLQGLPSFPAIAIAGIVGALFDSAFGSLIQAKYRCPVCGAEIEEPRHCNARAIRKSGLAGIGNNAVNLISAFLGGVLAIEILDLLL